MNKRPVLSDEQRLSFAKDLATSNFKDWIAYIHMWVPQSEDNTHVYQIWISKANGTCWCAKVHNETNSIRLRSKDNIRLPSDHIGSMSVQELASQSFKIVSFHCQPGDAPWEMLALLKEIMGAPSDAIDYI